MGRVTLSELMILALLICAVPGAAQSNPPVSMCGAYAIGYAASSPKPSGGAFCAIPLTSGGGVVSFTEYQPVFSGAPVNVQVATRSGLATPCKAIGPVTIYCIGTVGAATAGTQSTFTASTGAVAFWPLTKSRKWFVVTGFEVPWVSTPLPGQTSTARQWGFGFSRSLK